MADHGAPVEAPDTVAPLADLLFSLATVIVAVLVAVLPAMVAAGDGADPIAALLARERPALLLAADAAGVAVHDGAGPVRRIPVDALLDDPALPLRLQVARETGEPPVLVIADDGGEAAFLLDGLFARAGVPLVRQIRLEGATMP